MWVVSWRDDVTVCSDSRLDVVCWEMGDSLSSCHLLWKRWQVSRRGLVVGVLGGRDEGPGGS